MRTIVPSLALDPALACFGEQLGQDSLKRSDELVKLKSSLRSHWFIDLREGHARGRTLKSTGAYMLRLTHQVEYGIVAGEGVDGRAVVSSMITATGGVSDRQELQARWVNSKSELSRDEDPKNGWGYRSDDEEIRGASVLVVDGTLTTGGSVRDFTEMTRQAGAIVNNVAVVVDRSEDGAAPAELAADLGVGVFVLFEFSEQTEMLTPAARMYLPPPHSSVVSI